LFSLCFTNILFGQTDSACDLRISLLTCSPGPELYEAWGHSALRISDNSTQTDLIYNYGTFDFDDPSFYSKFTRGKLLYFVSVDSFANFIDEYKYFRRGITEQVLNLSCAEKQHLLDALKENAKEENKYYKYDFILDNCTTRLRDIVLKNAGNSIVTKNILEKRGTTFRKLIHDYLDKSHQYWSKLGIDILLGEPVDKKITNKEAMFLPDYLLKGLDSTTIPGRSLVATKTEILRPALPENKSPLFSPFTLFTILLVFITGLSFYKPIGAFLSVFDFILFFLAGLLGILILCMWFGTDHPECKNNINLLWAFPFHFIIIFFIYNAQNFLRATGIR